jgi:uncharacterized protein (TIGR00288 family)
LHPPFDVAEANVAALKAVCCQLAIHVRREKPSFSVRRFLRVESTAGISRHRPTQLAGAFSQLSCEHSVSRCSEKPDVADVVFGAKGTISSRHRWVWSFVDNKRRQGMGHESRVAVFVDAENVAQWVKLGGIDTLLEDLSSIGPVVVRKAYARWTNENMLAHQATLNRHGFELIHTFHPASGKNSADIQITVDVMEYASREDLACITLATGDSDFSPLFRRLREMGKQVIGVGPRSALSESVKSSCSRFFYTQTETASPIQDEASRTSAFDDAADLLESTLKTFDGPANCSQLKNRMLNIDSAFDEKALGFKTFTAFVRAV